MNQKNIQHNIFTDQIYKEQLSHQLFFSTQITNFKIKLFYLITINLLLITTNSSTAIPTQRITEPYYFGSHYIKFIVSIDNIPTAQPYSSSTVYTYQIPLSPKTYENIASVLPVFSSFLSSQSTQFGWTLNAQCLTDPASLVQIRFSVLRSTLFHQIGFHIIIITEPFDKIILSDYIYVNQINVWIEKLFPIVLSPKYKYAYFIKDYDGRSGPTFLNFLVQYYNSRILNNKIGLKVVNGDGGIFYSSTFLFIIIDITQLQKMSQFSLLVYQHKMETGNSCNSFPTTNFNVNTTKFGTNLLRKCIIGLYQIDGIMKYNPVFNYDIDINGQIMNGADNSYTCCGFAHTFEVQTLCFQDYQCPITHNFKMANSSLCYNCSSDMLVSGTGALPSICLADSLLMRKYQYNYLYHQIINTCYYCIDCIDTHFAKNGHCLLCDTVISNCIKCEQSPYMCLQCQLTYFLDIFQTQCLTCFQLIPFCINCDSQNKCLQCFNGLTLNVTQNKCQLLGCMIIQLSPNNQIICKLCQIFKNFIMNTNNQCVCKDGFQLNSLTNRCDQICGDGKTYKLQCDDANTNNLDGCDQNCQIVDRFKCKIIQNISYCRLQINLQLSIQKIIKQQYNNSAIIYVKANNQIFPFDFDKNHFVNLDCTDCIKYVKVQILTSTNPVIKKQITAQVINAYGRDLQIMISYDIDIQNYPAELSFNTSKTKYICENNQTLLKFTMKGSNNKLQIINNVQQITNISNGMLANTIIINLLLIIGIFSIKYIGLQNILTLQLIFYSQLLITPQQNWPQGFLYLKYLKYCNGYNQIIQTTSYKPLSQIQIKFSLLQIKKQPFQNFNINFFILVIVFIFFIISSIIYQRIKFTVNKKLQKQLKINQSKKTKNLIKKQKQNKQNRIQNKNSKIKELQRIKKFNMAKFIVIISYQAISQICKWSILQIISSFAAFLFISNNNVKIIQSYSIIKYIQKWQLIISFFIVMFIGLNNFKNIFLSDQIFKNFIKRSQQILYKRLNFIYLMVIGFLILFFNSIKIFNIPTSMIVLVFHAFYLYLINFKVRPYKNSLQIHQNILLLQHGIYLIFLLFINLINFISEINQLILIVFGYSTILLSSISLIFTIIRLYYQYRYGEALQIQLKKLKQQQQKIKKIKIKQKQLKKIQSQKKQTKKQQQQQNKNLYKYQNYIFQQEKIQVLQWLQKRNHLTTLQKEQYYYQRFKQKPLKWLKKHEQQKYKQILQLQKQNIYLQQNQNNWNNNQKNNNKNTQQLKEYQQSRNLNKLQQKIKKDNLQYEKLKLKMKKNFQQKINKVKKNTIQKNTNI